MGEVLSVNNVLFSDEFLFVLSFMKQRYFHLQGESLYALSKNFESNGVVYLKCPHNRSSKKHPQGCQVTGKIEGEGPLTVEGIHMCGAPLNTGECLSEEIRSRTLVLCQKSNESSSQITDNIIREFDKDGVPDITRDYLKTDSFLNYVKSAIQSFKEPLYKDSIMLSNSQDDSDPFTHPVLDRTSNEYVFYRKKRLETLPDKLMIFVDETFKTVPSPYLSCLNIIGYDSSKNDLIPLFHSLLAREGNEETFRRHFHLFLSALSFKTTVEGVMLDFSSSLIRAAQSVFKDARIIGCRFHFLQAIRKHLKKTFSNDQDTVENLMKRIKRFPGLENEDGLKERLGQVIQYYQDNEKVTEFFEGYFQRTWMKMHPPKLWMNNLPFRTNNPVETFHSSLKEKLERQAQTPSIFREALKELYDSWKQVKSGRPTREKKTKLFSEGTLESLFLVEKAKEDDFKFKRKLYACSWCREHRGTEDTSHTLKTCTYKCLLEKSKRKN